jgi:hypothetical protein
MDALKRAIRTLLQAGIAGALISLAQEFNWIDWSESQSVAAMVVVTMVVTFIQNALEDNTPLPTVLKPDVYQPPPH